IQGAHYAWNIQGHRGRGYLARQFCRSRKSCGRRSGTYRPTHALVRGRRTARQHRGRQGTGIPGHRENRLQDRAIKDLYSLAETCASCVARGDKFSYSNLGYHILATRRSVCVVSPGDDVYRSIPSRKMLFERLLRGTGVRGAMEIHVPQEQTISVRWIPRVLRAIPPTPCRVRARRRQDRREMPPRPARTGDVRMRPCPTMPPQARPEKQPYTPDAPDCVDGRRNTSVRNRPARA